MKDKDLQQRGALIVEATIVFPIMFLVIFVMVFLGNAYFQRSRVEAIAADMAFFGASQCADPLLKVVQENNGVPALSDADYEIEPYRYILGGMSKIVSDVENQIYSKVRALKTGLFSGMRPSLSRGNVSVKFNNLYVYSTFTVELSYKVPMPIRLLGMRDYFSIQMSSRYDIPVSDTPEFIRNVDMVEDWLESTGTGAELIEKTKNVMGKIGEFIN